MGSSPQVFGVGRGPQQECPGLGVALEPRAEPWPLTVGPGRFPLLSRPPSSLKPGQEGGSLSPHVPGPLQCFRGDPSPRLVEPRGPLHLELRSEQKELWREERAEARRGCASP